MISEATGEACPAKIGRGDLLGHNQTLQCVGSRDKPRSYIPCKDTARPPLHNVEMADAPFPNHVRAWRMFRHLTQEELAEAVGCSTATIGHIETGVRRLSDKWAHPIAKVLSTSPGYLLDHDPNDLPTAILDVWADIPEESRPQALRVLESFKRTGTEG
ncbi:helix-turn-helix transcriptional regulator [Brevundimonas vesicularis]|uniref:helix-turn-helix domain-containing protein n=1 Tax=Brevundimonas vesicularis TaxID=41276 RepID=UPI002892A66F|nr:helix-turn-helix transcriptional regulator [Brevundimonas vesicularis]